MQPQQNSFASIPVQSAQQSPRRWYRPQFSLLTLFYIVTWAAVGLSVNLVPPEIHSYRSKGEISFYAERGWPFKYLSYSWETELSDALMCDARGWPVDVPLPFVTNWHKLVANALTFALFALILWLAPRWLRNLARIASHSIDVRNTGGFRLRAIPAGLLIVVGVAAIVRVIWIVASEFYQLLDSMPWSSFSDLLYPFQQWPVIFSGLLGGLLAIYSGRQWIRLSPYRILSSVAAVGVLGLFAVVAFSEFWHYWMSRVG